MDVFLLSLGGPVRGQLSSVLTLLILFPKLRLPVPCLFFYVRDMFSTQFCSSAGSDDCQVKQLK